MAVARARQIVWQIAREPSWRRLQDNDAIGDVHGFLDVAREVEDCSLLGQPDPYQVILQRHEVDRVDRLDDRRNLDILAGFI
jgi:hypothetical protein